jgi:hypothetical protein
MGSLAQFIGLVLGYALATLVRVLLRKRFWRQVAEDAKKDLADPTVPVDDPMSAAERVLAKKQREQVVAVARTITESGPQPAIGRTPSNLIDRPFETKRTRTPDTHPRGYRIGKDDDD